ncbi:alpha/beta fold hydrolase [Candidatus Leptofilum sp.]|uniref:alpha/beta fold hydrolase n=1 Tax=Candidatus Leptofilum sp. TaxID=3241576 RepID=UPI003B58CA34
MAKLTANGITIAYEMEGSGPPLVLVAGLGYSRWMWHKMVPGLTGNFTVISYDNRGVGESDKPAGPYTAQLLADDLAGLLGELGIEKTAVFGHSMGGFVAQAFALTYPEKVTHLILSATNFGGPRHVPVTQEALAVLMDMTSDPQTRLRNGILISCAEGFAERQPAVVEEWLAFRANNPIDPVGYQAQMGVGLSLMSEAACFEHKLSAITAPTLILSGDEDKVVPPANVDLLAAKISGAETAVIAQAGHFFPIEQPETAVGIVTNFLQKQ